MAIKFVFIYHYRPAEDWKSKPVFCLSEHKETLLETSIQMPAGLIACASQIREKEYTNLTIFLSSSPVADIFFPGGTPLPPGEGHAYLVMKIFATTPLSPSVLVPSNSGRNVSSIASSELHPSATSLAAASVSRVDIVHEISCLP